MRDEIIKQRLQNQQIHAPHRVSYTDRTAALPLAYTKQAITSNGIFSPIIVHHGKVIGLWKRKAKPKHIEIELLPFEPISKELTLEIKERFKVYQDYLGGLEIRVL